MDYSNIKGYGISRMTLGTVQLGMDYGIANKTGKPSTKKAFEIIDAAVKGGINSYDTSNLYGDSEKVLGKYFSSESDDIREKTLITTKLKIDSSRGIDRESIEKQMYDYARQSIKLLGIDKIPIYLLHNAKDMNQFGDAVPETLEKLKADGLIEKAGVSVYSAEEVEKMLENDVYEAVQIPMNVFDLRMKNKGILKKLTRAQVIVFVRSVFLQGMFFMDPMNLPDKFRAAARPLKQLINLADRERISIAQLAVSFIRDMEGVTSLVIGAETIEQVKENIRLMNGPCLSRDISSQIEGISEKVPIEHLMKEILNGK